MVNPRDPAGNAEEEKLLGYVMMNSSGLNPLIMATVIISSLNLSLLEIALFMQITGCPYLSLYVLTGVCWHVM